MIETQEELDARDQELMPYEPLGGGVPGTVRRIRRILDVSQRGLAELLGVSQSVVARWETARTSPTAEMLVRLARMAGLSLVLRDADGNEVEPMRDDGARDVAQRRFPAHVDLTARAWWAPRGHATWADLPVFLAHSRQLGRPAVRFHRQWMRHLQRLLTGTPVDHPSTVQLALEVDWHDEQRAERRRKYREAREVSLRHPTEGYEPTPSMGP